MLLKLIKVNLTGLDILIALLLHQTPSTASESASEPEAITAPVPSQPPPPTTSLNSYYNTAPCLPPYTAYDLQVPNHFKPAALPVC